MENTNQLRPFSQKEFNEDYRNLMSFFKERNLALWKHENNELEKQNKELINGVYTNYPFTNCYFSETENNEKLFFVFNNTFKNIIDIQYKQAFLKYPEKFGTGNANDVLEALYNVFNDSDSNVFNWSNDDYKNFLYKERYCFVIKKTENGFFDNVLKIDLFRQFKPSKEKENNFEFIGGLFHALKHFSMFDRNLSIEKEINKISNIEDILILTSESFFKGIDEKNGKYYSFLDLVGLYHLKFCFYFEKETNTYFINTIYKERNDIKIRELQKLAVTEMFKSISEHEDRADPKVGAVLAYDNGELIETAHRGELRIGDHAEFTLIERKCKDKNLQNAVLFATLEPCAPGARKSPKKSCAERIVNARIKKVFIGVEDPDPLVKGKGTKYLQDNGVLIEYFDKDLQNIILEENEKFIAEAKIRAQNIDKEQLLPQRTEMEIGLEHFDWNDFSEDAFKLYIERANLEYSVHSDEFKKLLLKWGFVEKNKAGVFQPTGWGLILFGNRPTDKYPQTRIKFTVINEAGNTEIQDFTEALVKIPLEIEKYLKFALPSAIDRSGFERKEIRDISIQTLREAIINAIVHRDYTILGAQILVEITPNKITIQSPGEPIVDLKKLQKFEAPTVSRNAKLSEVFYAMHFIERRGIGMKEIATYIPKPKYDFDGHYLTLTFERKQIKTIDKLNYIEKACYDLIVTEKSISKNSIAEKLNIDDKKAQRILRELIDAYDLIRTKGKARATVYELAE